MDYSAERDRSYSRWNTIYRKFNNRSDRRSEMIKLKNLILEQERIFQNKDANTYLKELINMLGQPTYKSNKEYGWYNIILPEKYNVTKVDKIYIIDESINHSFPKPHRDYVYTMYTIPEWKQNIGKHVIDSELFKQFADVTGSIIIDGLKGTVTARCGDIIANDITIKFVLDVISNQVEPTKEEYSKRILGR
jgi:hypothetical protein